MDRSKRVASGSEEPTCGKALPARLPFGVEPEDYESPRGLLCRLAYEYHYPGPGCSIDLIGLDGPSDLEDEKFATRVDFALRLDSGRWAKTAYMRIGRGRFKKRRFFGHLLAADRLNYGRPRVCPRCLADRSIWYAGWDLKIICACPIHGCLMIDRCPRCHKYLTWARPAPHLCQCGIDLSKSATRTAPPEIVAIATTVYLSAGLMKESTLIDTCEGMHFPPEVRKMRLDLLLEIIFVLGTLHVDRTRKQTSITLTRLSEAKKVCHRAALLMTEWPNRFNRLLQTIQSNQSGARRMNLKGAFGPLYTYWLSSRGNPKLKFFSSAFEGWIRDHWEGIIRGQNSAFTFEQRRLSRWIPIAEAAREAGIGKKQICELVRRRDIVDIVIRATGSSRTECWINRATLSGWISRRDQELAASLTEKDASRALGLSRITIRTIVAGGVISQAHGWEKWFVKDGPYYRRQDVERIQDAFNALTDQVIAHKQRVLHRA